MTIFYILWFILTCLNQFHYSRLQKFLSKIDIFKILPIWTFFAPNPGTSDYYLLYRVRKKNGLISRFNNVSLRNRKSIINAIWNPHKRSQKALNDFVQEIRRVINTADLNETNQHLLKLSFSYVVTLHYCTELTRHITDVESVQFMIIESFGHFELKESRLILNSDFHNL